MKKNIAIIVLSITVLVLGICCSLLYTRPTNNESNNIETERKFLVDTLPKAFETASQERMVQTYINFSPEMRVRQINEVYHFFTMKLPKDDIGLSREEIEVMITKEEYEELLLKQVGSTIYKVRHQFYENGYKMEVDIYSHQLSGLKVVEVEFPDVRASQKFPIPSWFGLEVTSDSRYKNANLARYGMPVD